MPPPTPDTTAPAAKPTRRGRALGPALAVAIALHAIALALIVRTRPAPPSLAWRRFEYDAFDPTIELFDEAPAPSLPSVEPSPSPPSIEPAPTAPLAAISTAGALTAPRAEARVAASQPPEAVPAAALRQPKAPEALADAGSAAREAEGAARGDAARGTLAGAAPAAPRALNFSLPPGALGGAEPARPGPLAGLSPAERNLEQALVDGSVPFGIRDPLMYAARVAIDAPGAPTSGQAYFALAFDERGVVHDITLLSANSESEGWGLVRDAFAGALRGRSLAAGGRGGRATLALGAAVLPIEEPGPKKPRPHEPQYVPREKNVGPDEPVYKGESGSVTPHKFPVITPGMVIGLVREGVAITRGQRSSPSVHRVAFARIVRFRRD